MSWFKKNKSPEAPKVVEFGRYLHKPITGRAIHFVTGYDLSHLLVLVADKKLVLNGKPIEENGLLGRLEAGQYVISHADGNLSWRFFIA